MKNYSLKENSFFFVFVLFSAIVFILSVFDITLDLGLEIFLIISYIIIFTILILSILFYYQKRKIPPLSVDEFEKSLSGGLFHFKCPVCGGIFAVKKSRGNNGINTKMTCPDCGIVGNVRKNPECVIEEIPEKKSLKANFRCRNCGEGVTVWAEGSDLYNDTKVLVCPFCDIKKPLQKL